MPFPVLFYPLTSVETVPLKQVHLNGCILRLKWPLQMGTVLRKCNHPKYFLGMDSKIL